MAHTWVTPGSRARLLRFRGWPLPFVALTVSFALYAWPFVVDDAFITARYAQRIVAGGGYGFNTGATSDGVTGPLWLLPLLIAERLQIDTLLVAKLCGLGSCLLALVLVWQRARERARGSASSLLALLFTSSSSALWIWSIGGLETGAACLAATLLLVGMARTRPRTLQVGLAAGALLWLRPELSPLVLFSLGSLAVRAPGIARRAALLVAASLSLLVLFRLSMFGELLPLSAHAKPAMLQHGLRYVLASLQAPAALCLVPALLCAARWGAREDRTLFLALCVHGLAVLLAGGDWMASARLFVPVVPVACYVAARGITLLGLRAPRVALFALALLCAVRTYGLAHELPRARASGELRDARLPLLLRALRPLGEPIALLDVGAVGYFGQRRIIDLGGLTDAKIAHSPGGHLSKRIDSAWLERQTPAAIVLHSAERPRVDSQDRLRWFAGYPVERTVSAMRWVIERYRVRDVIEYDSDYFYVVLVRHERPAL